MRRHEQTFDETLAFRQVIPRWRSPADSTAEVAQYQVDGPTRPSTRAEHWFAKVAERYVEHPDSDTATDLVEVAFVLGREPAHPSVVGLARSLSATTVLDQGRTGSKQAAVPSEEELRTKIQQLRDQVRRFPKQPLAWSELSRAYISLGHTQKASQAMVCALGSAPRNHYLLRSASRLFTLLDEPDRALTLLRRHGGLGQNPHLLSAELAIASSAQLPLRHERLAEQMLADKKYSPRHLAELAAAVGTIEHQHGKHKRAKARFMQSLKSPTENSLAQAYWISKQDSKIVIPEQAWNVPRPHEANAFAFRERQDWQGVARECAAWLRDQPFDASPALMGSYCGVLPSLETDAEAIATAGLVAHPHHSGLLNNRAVSRLYIGDLDGARIDIEKATFESSSDAHLLATMGLLAFRSGELELGRELYLKSILWFKDCGEKASVLLSTLHWLREEVRLGSIGVHEVLDGLRAQVEAMQRTRRGPDIALIYRLILIEAEAMHRYGTQQFNFPSSPSLAGAVGEFTARLGVPDVVLQEASNILHTSDTRTLATVPKIESFNALMS